jgi:signal transduction histidine kinase
MRQLQGVSDSIHLRAAEDAAAVGLVAAIVAHDAHNVLVSMIAEADAVLESTADPVVAQSVRVLSDGCWRIAAMLRRLITVGQRGQPTQVDANRLIAELAPTLHALVRGRVQLTTHLESPIPSVLIDAADLERAVLNLVANARDASNADGVVSIATSRIDEWVVVVVEDHGVGMDAETSVRATEAFFTTKPVGVGTGLGLASVARFVHDAGGRLDIESVLGRGTRVRLFLPAI